MKRFILFALCSVCVNPAVLADVMSVQLNLAVSFQAVSWQGNNVLASGTAGGIYASTDNGLSWHLVAPPAGSGERQFRDNQQLDSGRIIVMSAGEGAESGLFVSDNAGQTWTQTSQGQTGSAFYDCFYMVNDSQGYLYGDSDEQGLFVLSSHDGGDSWQRESVFAAQPQEGGFASSGTCLAGFASNGIVIGTGNAEQARLIWLAGGKWSEVSSPIPAEEAGGIFSVQSDDETVYVSGGSLKLAEVPAQAWTFDTVTQQWQQLPALPLKGAVYGSALLPVAQGVEFWVSSPQGVAVLKPGSDDWQQVSHSNIWSLACHQGKGCIGVGKEGRVERYLP